MTRNFNIGSGEIVFATVTTIPCANYFFVQNGAPGHILCHINQGGALEVSSAGHLLLKSGVNIGHRMIGEKIVLIRSSENSISRNYTKAGSWVLENDWENVKWALNAHTTFRAVAHDHRNNGHYQSNTQKEIELTVGKLIEIVNKSPRCSNDPLGESYSNQLGNTTLSYKVRWERLSADEKWAECGDPRPVC